MLIRFRRFRFRQIGLAAIVCLLGLLGLTSPVHALVLSIDQANQHASPGGTVIFTGTITNDTGVDLDAATDLSVNIFNFNLTVFSPPPDQLLGSPDFFLPNGATSADVALFDVNIDSSATPAGSPYLADVTISDLFGDVSNDVTISITVPEPASLSVLFAAIIIVIGFTKGGIWMKWVNRLFVASLIFGMTFLAGSGYAAVTPVSLYVATSVTSVWGTDNTKVGVELQIANNGTAAADNVRVTSVTVQGGSLSSLGPNPPIDLGTIDPQDGARLDVVINASTTDGTTRYLLTVNGTYSYAGGMYGFSVNRALFPNSAGPGPVSSVNGLAMIFNPNTAVFPPAPTPPTFGPNAETPILVPIGPFSQIFTPTPTPTPASTTMGGASVQIPVNNTRGVGVGIPPDPNAATSGGGVVLSTYNTGISYSTMGGMPGTFTDVNLFNPIAGRTSFFPQSDGGLCCDQVVVYLPNQNLFFWLQQYWPITACATNCGPPPAKNATFKITQPNRLRVAWATPEAIKADFNNAWTYIDLTAINTPGVSSGLGVKSNEWMDYPDLAWSDNFLYVGVDHGFPTPGQVYTGQRIVARLSLADIVNPASSTVGYQYALLTGSNGLNKDHFVQSAPNRLVLGSLDNSSTMRVFTWDDGSNSINNSTVGISSINQGANYTSLAPDGSDWLASSFPGNITGAVYRQLVLFGLPPPPPREEYIFAFDAGVNGAGRPRSYVRLETLTPSGGNFSAFAEYDIWNTDYAFAMAALARDNNNVTPEVAINLAVGGGTVGYPQMSVGFKDDFVVYQVTSSNAAQQGRFGDYLSARYIAGSDSQFGAEAYDVILNPVPPGGTATCAAVGCTANPRYIQFGRPPFQPPG